MNVGILPVKSLAAAKSRLAEIFDVAQRRELATAMLEDALDLCSSADFLEWFVLTADPVVEERARARGIGAIADPPGTELNSALQFAIGSLSRRGASSATIVPADAPLATVDDLRDLLDTGAVSDLVVVPAERDAGTNGLYLSPPDVVAPRFGEGSFSAYVEEAEAKKLRCSILPLAGFAIDVDIPDDVRSVLGHASRETRSIRLLRSWSGVI